MRRLGKLSLLALLGEVGLGGLRQEPQVIGLGPEVGQVDVQFRLRQVPLGVQVDVAVLLRLLGGEALRQFGLARVEFFGVAFAVVFVSEAFEALTGGVEDLPRKAAVPPAAGLIIRCAEEPLVSVDRDSTGWVPVLIFEPFTVDLLWLSSAVWPANGLPVLWTHLKPPCE